LYFHQVERGKQKGDEEPEEPKYTELVRPGDEETPIKLDLKLGEAVKAIKRPPVKVEDVLSASTSSSGAGVFKKPKTDWKGEEKKPSKIDVKPNALAEIMAENEARKEKQNRKDVWITEGIIVKVMAKSLGDQYYRKKGAIIQVGSAKNPDLRDPYTAIVKMNETGARIKLDQAHLETVIPNIGQCIILLLEL
jgi:DNA/RNA-binding protein KIN17